MNKRELENLEAHYLSQVMCLERRLQDHRDLLREIVAYARECGHDWLSLHEADALLSDGAALNVAIKRETPDG